jgi:hypothetical protein
MVNEQVANWAYIIGIDFFMVGVFRGFGVAITW